MLPWQQLCTYENFAQFHIGLCSYIVVSFFLKENTNAVWQERQRVKIQKQHELVYGFVTETKKWMFVSDFERNRKIEKKRIVLWLRLVNFSLVIVFVDFAFVSCFFLCMKKWMQYLISKRFIVRINRHLISKCDKWKWHYLHVIFSFALVFHLNWNVVTKSHKVHKYKSDTAYNCNSDKKEQKKQCR